MSSGCSSAPGQSPCWSVSTSACLLLPSSLAICQAAPHVLLRGLGHCSTVGAVAFNAGCGGLIAVFSGSCSECCLGLFLWVHSTHTHTPMCKLPSILYPLRVHGCFPIQMQALHSTCSINLLCIHTMLAALYAWCIRSLRSTTEVSQPHSVLVLCFISQSIWRMLGCHGWQSDSPLCCIRHKWNQATLFRSNTWVSPYWKCLDYAMSCLKSYGEINRLTQGQNWLPPLLGVFCFLL